MGWARFRRLVVPAALLMAMPLAADDKEDLKKVLERFDAAYQARDADAIAQLIAPDADVSFLMPDVGSRWVGLAAIKAGLRAEFSRFKAVRIEAQAPALHVRGSIAWFERVLVMNLTLSEGEASILARSTGVLEKRGASWLLVQQHLSVGGQRDSGPRD